MASSRRPGSRMMRAGFEASVVRAGGGGISRMIGQGSRLGTIDDPHTHHSRSRVMRIHSMRSVALAVGLLAGPVWSQVPGGAAPAADASRIEHLLRPAVRIADRPDTAFDLVDRMRYFHVPGLSLAVVDNFKIVFARGYGVTEFGGSTPVDTTTLFLAGSISKPVFA